MAFAICPVRSRGCHPRWRILLGSFFGGKKPFESYLRRDSVYLGRFTCVSLFWGPDFAVTDGWALLFPIGSLIVYVAVCGCLGVKFLL